MPLNSDVQLQGPAPGSGPLKRAMVLRLSSETFDELRIALQSQANGHKTPPLQVQFGDHEPSSLFIGGRRIELTDVPENVYEIYKQKKSGNKASPQNPLQLFGTVSSSLIAKRVLNEDVAGRYHQRSIQAEEERTKRKAILLGDALQPTPNKKRKVTASASTVSSLAKQALNQSRSKAAALGAIATPPSTHVSPAPIDRPLPSPKVIPSPHTSSPIPLSASVGSGPPKRLIPKATSRPSEPPQPTADGFLTSTWKGGMKPKVAATTAAASSTSTSKSSSTAPARKTKTIKSAALIPETQSRSASPHVKSSESSPSSSGSTRVALLSDQSTATAIAKTRTSPLPQAPAQTAVAPKKTKAVTNKKSKISHEHLESDADIAAYVDSVPAPKRTRGPPVDRVEDELVAAAASVPTKPIKSKSKAAKIEDELDAAAASTITATKGKRKGKIPKLEDELVEAAAATTIAPKPKKKSQPRVEDELVAAASAVPTIAVNGKPKKKTAKRVVEPEPPIPASSSARPRISSAPEPSTSSPRLQPPSSVPPRAVSAAKAPAPPRVSSSKAARSAAAGSSMAAAPPKRTSAGEKRKPSHVYTSSEESDTAGPSSSKLPPPRRLTSAPQHQTDSSNRHIPTSTSTSTSTPASAPAPALAPTLAHSPTKRAPQPQATASTSVPERPPKRVRANLSRPKPPSLKSQTAAILSKPLPSDRPALRDLYSEVYVQYSAVWARVLAEKHRQEQLLKTSKSGGEAEEGEEEEEEDGEIESVSGSTSSGAGGEDVEELSKTYAALHTRLLEIRNTLES